MKKAKKRSIFLTFLGVFMFGSACILEFVILKKNVAPQKTYYEKVALRATTVIETGIKSTEINKEETSLEEEKGKEEEEDKTTLQEQEKVYDLVLPITEPVVFEKMTLKELGEKLERSLNSDLVGYGNLIATHTIELGLDPYLALAIILHETGCKWNCSTLVKSCNNVGGQKGGPSCNGGSYKAYNTLEEGIIGYLDNLYTNYYAKGYTTPETIGPRYAGSSTWVSQVQSYIAEIRAA